MKKIYVITGIVALLLVFGVVGTVFAQSDKGFDGVLLALGTPDPDEETPFVPGNCGAFGDVDGEYSCEEHDDWEGMHHGSGNPMHDNMVVLIADATGLSVDEINVRMVGGESMYQIMEAEGLDEADLAELHSMNHTDSVMQAVEDGWLTQDHADWMSERMDWRWGGEYNGESNDSSFSWHGRGRGCGGMQDLVQPSLQE